jgi:hypothetical protein
MGAGVTIFRDNQVEQALTVPLQAIFGSAELGKKRKCFVKNDEGIPEERDIEIGLSNDKMAEVRAGLKVGDEVVLNPRALLGDKVKTRHANSGDQNGGVGPQGRNWGENGRSDGPRGPGGRSPGNEAQGTDERADPAAPGQRPGARREGGPRNGVPPDSAVPAPVHKKPM